MNDYDTEATPCLCPDCDMDAAYGSELCGGCEWFNCTPTKCRHHG